MPPVAVTVAAPSDWPHVASTVEVIVAEICDGSVILIESVTEIQNYHLLLQCMFLLIFQKYFE